MWRRWKTNNNFIVVLSLLTIYLNFLFSWLLTLDIYIGDPFMAYKSNKLNNNSLL